MSAYNITMRPLLQAARLAEGISLDEFSLSLLRLFDFKVPPVFGLAVSGGVDSMALALLSKKFATVYGTKAVAFTVNHALRPNSTVEAQNVSDIVRNKIGLDHEILNLDWKYVEQHGIERSARTLRYEALAKSCVRYNVEHLLLAHTLDDQVETVLMRLMRGARKSGLAGMRRISWIPGGKTVFGAEQVKILRPLLLEKKVRTIATCFEGEIPWFEDMTNHDPSYTKRNAIRVFLSSSDKLPVALRPRNVILFCERLSERRRQDDVASLNLLKKEVAATRIKLSTSKLLLTWTLNPIVYENMPLSVLVSFLRRLVVTISPSTIPDVSTRQYEEILKRLLLPVKGNFTFMGVLWTHSSRKITIRETAVAGPVEKRKIRSWTTGKIIESLSESQFSEPIVLTKLIHTWKLSRESMGNDKYSTALVTVPAVGWSEWVLWDNRLWIRCAKAYASDDTSSKTIVIRPFTENDRIYIHKLGNDVRHSFDRTMKPAKGVDITTLPVIHDPELCRILSIPTLDFLLESEKQLKYEVKMRDHDFVTDKR
ncbi:PP-loop family-domain-containing protein [Lipomyces arxii]|uniref:PP-loop family-domain-containing protein n=1 Tax=Lipomyces arxii TaxID=56418 RepID=UPI0034CEF7A8